MRERTVVVRCKNPCVSTGTLTLIDRKTDDNEKQINYNIDNMPESICCGNVWLRTIFLVNQVNLSVGSVNFTTSDSEVAIDVRWQNWSKDTTFKRKRIR